MGAIALPVAEVQLSCSKVAQIKQWFNEVMRHLFNLAIQEFADIPERVGQRYATPPVPLIRVYYQLGGNAKGLQFIF